MSTLPPLPEPFFDGGDPQSSIAPGDTGRELIHEVRNLAQAVTLLHSVVRKQRARQQQVIWTVGTSLLVLLLALGFSRYLTVDTSRERLAAAYDACQADNARGNIEIEMLEAVVLRSESPEAEAFFRPRINAFQGLQKDCRALYPSRPQDPGYPTFWP